MRGLGLRLTEHKGKCVVSQISPNSIAFQNGVKINDILLAINGKDCSSVDSAVSVLRSCGAVLHLTILRQNVAVHVTITLGSEIRPASSDRALSSRTTPEMDFRDIELSRLRAALRDSFQARAILLERVNKMELEGNDETATHSLENLLANLNNTLMLCPELRLESGLDTLNFLSGECAERLGELLAAEERLSELRRASPRPTAAAGKCEQCREASIGYGAQLALTRELEWRVHLLEARHIADESQIRRADFAVRSAADQLEKFRSVIRTSQVELLDAHTTIASLRSSDHGKSVKIQILEDCAAQEKKFYARLLGESIEQLKTTSENSAMIVHSMKTEMDRLHNMVADLEALSHPTPQPKDDDVEINEKLESLWAQYIEQENSYRKLRIEFEGQSEQLGILFSRLSDAERSKSELIKRNKEMDEMITELYGKVLASAHTEASLCLQLADAEVALANSEARCLQLKEDDASNAITMRYEATKDADEAMRETVKIRSVLLTLQARGREIEALRQQDLNLLVRVETELNRIRRGSAREDLCAVRTPSPPIRGFPPLQDSPPSGITIHTIEETATCDGESDRDVSEELREALAEIDELRCALLSSDARADSAEQSLAMLRKEIEDVGLLKEESERVHTRLEKASDELRCLQDLYQSQNKLHDRGDSHTPRSLSRPSSVVEL